MDEKVAYRGKEKLVIAVDLGATQSAVSFVHLVPGTIPQVQLVNRWPGQEEAVGFSKTPTLVCYEGGRPIAFGAEAIDAQTEKTHIAKWFKLLLNPKSMRSSSANLFLCFSSKSSSTLDVEDLVPLPPKVTLAQVYADYLGYLFDHARTFISTNVPDGRRIWDSLKDTITFVLATPNGWDDIQQGFLRKAVVQAGLLPDKFDDERLNFVTESEASIHSVLHYHDRSDWLNTGDTLALLDAGGATVDTTLYKVTSSEPLTLEEVCASECIQAGGVFVDLEAGKMLRKKLSGSQYGKEDVIDDIMEEFERKTKRRFDGATETSIIKFGRDTDNDKKFGIWKGRLSLTNAEVKAAFEPSFSRIMSSTRKLLQNRKAKYLLVVGGYGGSPYLQKTLENAWQSDGLDVVAHDDTTYKAAAEGAALWMIKHVVTARAVRATFGVNAGCWYDEKNANHLSRASQIYKGEGGALVIPGGLEAWVRKGDVIPETQKTLFPYHRVFTSLDKALKDLQTFRTYVLAYEEEGEVEWCRDTRGNYIPGLKQICTLSGDLSKLSDSLQTKECPDGSLSYRVDYSVAVLFGGTSLRASLQWKEGGEMREGPVAVIPVD